MPEVLFTKDIDQKELAPLKEMGWLSTCIPFIDCTFSYDKSQLSDCPSNKEKTEAYIFTSKNAVNAIIEAKLEQCLNQHPVFCVGKKTGESLEAKGIDIIYSPESNSESLAFFILKNHPEIQHLTYFCGNKRREELPRILFNAGKVLKEFIVYKTELVSQQVEKDFDAIVFYSPSAVEAFFQSNKIKKNCKAIALGNATAIELEKYYKGNIEISDSPNTEAVIESLRKIENV